MLTRGELKARQDYTHLLSVTLILGLKGTQKELSFKPSQHSGPLSQCVAPQPVAAQHRNAVWLSTCLLRGPPHGVLASHTTINSSFKGARMPERPFQKTTSVRSGFYILKVCQLL